MVRHLVNDVQLLDSELVNLVQDINTRDIVAIAFNDIDQLIDGGITTTENIRRHDAIFSADGVDQLGCEDALRNHGLEVDRTAILAPIE